VLTRAARRGRVRGGCQQGRVANYDPGPLSAVVPSAATEMLLLYETAAGFALFKVLKEGKVEEAESLDKDFATVEKAQKLVKFKKFAKFADTTEALASAAALVDSKLSKSLKKLLKKELAEGETLALADAKLGNVIKDKLGIACVYSSGVMELLRGVRALQNELLGGIGAQELQPMSLGLSHSLSRYKLKFSPEKVDTMIVQAIGLLDDLDKELNTYAMRVREWYGWHFPEMGKVVQDNVDYAKVVKFMGMRAAAADLDFSEILAEEVEDLLKEAAVVSMGTEISQQDIENITHLCDQVIALSEYRAQLAEYLKSRMNALAPNLTVLVGEMVGARLIAHAGSLVSLAKHPASTVQILGAEKALFRALKTKHETPKYGLIYHASLIGQSAPKFKGKISRVLAAKCSLAIRVDALGEAPEATIGIESRAKVEARLRQLEGKAATPTSAKITAKPLKYEASDDATGYNPAADNTAKSADVDTAMQTPKSEKKKKKKKDGTEENGDNPKSSEKKKKKKKQAEDDDEVLAIWIALADSAPTAWLDLLYPRVTLVRGCAGIQVGEEEEEEKSGRGRGRNT